MNGDIKSKTKKQGKVPNHIDIGRLISSYSNGNFWLPYTFSKQCKPQPPPKRYLVIHIDLKDQFLPLEIEIFCYL
jgi:hypothetical protein